MSKKQRLFIFAQVLATLFLLGAFIFGTVMSQRAKIALLTEQNAGLQLQVIKFELFKASVKLHVNDSERWNKAYKDQEVLRLQTIAYQARGLEEFNHLKDARDARKRVGIPKRVR